MFGDIQNIDQYMGMFPWVVGVTALLIVLFIFAKFWKAAVSHKVSNQTFLGMTVQDIDKMRRDGVISEAEYKTIRHKAAERELESSRHKDEAERERIILAEAEIDPDAARKLLKPEQIRKSSAPAPAAAQPPAEPVTTAGWGDPLAGLAGPESGVAPPPAEPPGELELLLEKGAITREDYERFKSMMKK